jgi:hypothetical protein
MANKPNISHQSSATFYVAQNPHQAYQGLTRWHPQIPQMTQSLGASALQSNLQADMPPQQSPPKVRTPVKRIKDLVFTHGPFGV